MSAIDTYLQRNTAYAAGFAAVDLAAAPAKRIAIVTCMDARIAPAALLGLGAGDAHVIRNAGGIVTDDVIRSLLLSQRLLGAREIMVIQHTRCGLTTFTEKEMRDAIEHETGQRPPFTLGAFADLETSVRDSMTRIRTSRFVAHPGALRGFVYEVDTGRLREVR